MAMIKISSMDKKHYESIRKNVRNFLIRQVKQRKITTGTCLDIAPQIHEGAKAYFPPEVQIKTFDIDPKSGCDFIGDICLFNKKIKKNTFDYVICTEVLEHTLKPFEAIREIHRILKPAGLFLMTVPFNFRIHGPLPDCWRFTEHGIRSLLEPLNILELQALETPSRALMPIHYTVVAKKKP